MTRRNSRLRWWWASTILTFFFVVSSAEEIRPRFETRWILVKARAPLPQPTAGGEFSLATRRPDVDAAIIANQIHRIDHALSVAMRAPKNPKALKRLGLDRVYRFHVPSGTDILEAVRKFSEMPWVEYAHPDNITQQDGTLVPDDPFFSFQWNFEQVSDADVDGPEAWDITTGGSLILGVLDSGVDHDHLDLASKILQGYDFVNNDNDPHDDSNHGSGVASVAAGVTDNSLGVAGTCWNCMILPAKVFNDEGQGTVSWLTDSVVFAVDGGARVLNFSGSVVPDELLLDAIHYARDFGVLFIASGGNGVAIPFPGRYRDVVAVGASNDLDEKASFSSSGRYMDVLAPGEDILTANNTGGYHVTLGSSFSSPLVAGLAALILEVHPTAGREELRELIHAGSEDQVGPPADDTAGFDTTHGWGRVNMHDTLIAAQSATTLRLSGGALTRLAYDTASPVATSYDFVRGDLGALSASDGKVGLGSTICVENDSPDHDTLGDEDAAIPASGQAFFYLGRPNWNVWPASYGGSSTNLDRIVPDPATAASWSILYDEDNSEFGGEVLTAGDVNGDGYDDVIVGARNHPALGGRSGAAYVYHGSSSGLSTTDDWNVISTQLESRYGFSVSTAGDVDGDGYDDVIVGEHTYDGTFEDEGRAHVYLGSSSGLSTTPHRTLVDPQFKARFGNRVRSAGDVNNDGFGDVLVSAQLYDGGQANEGKAYLYLGSNLGLSSTPAWTFETNQANSRLSAIGPAGDVNNDGYDDVIVGASQHDGSGIDSGRAWVFHGSMAGLSVVPDTTLDVTGTGIRLGIDVYTAGDVDNDDYDDVIVTSSLYTNGENEEGAVFVFPGSSTGVQTTHSWSFETDQPLANMAQAKTAGDVNNDGFADVIVGSNYFHQTRLAEGRAWIFLGSGAGLSGTPAWSNLGWQIDGTFGWSVAGAGNVNGDAFDDVIVGGRSRDNDGRFNEGAAFVYHGPTATMAVTQPAGCDIPVP